MQPNRIKSSLSMAALVAGALAAAPGIRAQTTNPNPAPAQTAQPPAQQNAQPPAQQAVHTDRAAEARVEKRISELYKQLQITEAQKPQWDQFAQVMRDNATSMETLYQDRASRLESMSAVENMQSYEKIAEQHAADMQKLLPAFEALYNTLSDRQKAAADRAFRASAERYARHREHG
jgi:periplasmic protein CpxP/Spy